MKGFLGKYWWLFLLRGIAAVIFGILAFVSPGITLATLVLVWGAYALADGIFSLIAAISGKTADEDRWMVGLQGAIGVIAGLIALVLPGATALGLLFAIAAWSLAIGVLQIVAAIKLRKEITGEFWLGLSGLLSILFAFFVIARPGAGALAVIWVIGAYALVFGVTLIAFAFRVKKHAAP
ncbi:HdeD family acid-resistance protein [Aestuariivirga sp.]|uniref:HdeD family acid-resistance protein n=1 Tax=Aestuariivirga sp. TaxID=2650926 RepID=UPI003593778F